MLAAMSSVEYMQWMAYKRYKSAQAVEASKKKMVVFNDW